MESYILPSNKKHIFGEIISKKKSILLFGAKGERIAFQIIVDSICSNVKIKANTNWKSEFFYERYINIKNPSCCFFKEGNYPDIMVDEDRAIEFGDNSSNYGELLIWCFLDIPYNIETDKMSIKFDVTSDEGMDTVNADIIIFDFSIPLENHNVTSFSICNEMINGNSKEVIKKMEELIDIGLKYRLSPSRILPWGKYPHKILIEKIKQYTMDKRCNNFSIPYRTFLKKDIVTNQEIEYIDIEDLYYLFIEMAKESNNQCNLFKKASFYITFTDEPTPDKFFIVRRVYREIHDLKRKVAKEYDFSKKREVELSLLTMDNICTTFNKEPIYGEVDTWCPTYWGYRKPEYVYEEKILRKTGKKNWWYGCMGPMSPYPNLHTDSPMKDSRYESFLRYKFDIKGNLYWATNICKRYAGDKIGYVDCDILNGESNFSGVNGDGLLFYTQTKYGAPLPSLRVFSMFLGLEEYEYFYLFDKYLKKAVEYYNKNLKSRNLLENIFFKISVDSTLPYEFDCELIRKELGNRVVLAKNNIFIDSYYENGKRKVDIYSENNSEILLNGLSGNVVSCGNGVCNQYVVKDKNVLIGNILYKDKKNKLVTNSITLFEKQVYIEIKNNKILNNKVKVNNFQNGINIHLDFFVNEEKPSLYIPFESDFSDIREMKLDIESFLGDSFILNAILVDDKNNKFNIGYCVIEESSNKTYNIGVLKFAENRLNNVDEDIEFSKYISKNAKKANIFNFSKIKGIEIMFQNNIKLLDDNRERRISDYSFLINDIYVTLLK